MCLGLGKLRAPIEKEAAWNLQTLRTLERKGFMDLLLLLIIVLVILSLAGGAFISPLVFLLLIVVLLLFMGPYRGRRGRI
jgi:hypothetical protein